MCFPHPQAHAEVQPSGASLYEVMKLQGGYAVGPSPVMTEFF